MASGLLALIVLALLHAPMPNGQARKLVAGLRSGWFVTAWMRYTIIVPVVDSGGAAEM
jgi:hypothetical protein